MPATAREKWLRTRAKFKNLFLLYSTLTQLNNQIVATRDGTSQDFLDPTGKFQNLCRLTGRSSVFLQKVFVHCSMHLMKNFQKGGDGWGVKICDFKWDKILQKIKKKIFLRILQK